MEKQTIHNLTETFESYVQYTNSGIAFWLARDLQHLLGYTEWRNFVSVIKRAQTSCQVSGNHIVDHFVDVEKSIKMPKGAIKTVPDIMLTRYACYLIAQNGASHKTPIAFAQTYFAMQTRKAELIERKLNEQRESDSERISARKKLANTEKELSHVIFEQAKGSENFALIRSKGDHALFGKSTQAMKISWNIPENRPLADFTPTVLLKAKDFASEITIFNARQHHMDKEAAISKEHVSNNKAVRSTLVKRGIKPEKLSPEEDIKKVEKRLIEQQKKILK